MTTSLKITLTGTHPLIMHNIVALADPVSEISKSLKAISSKKTKTDADHLEMAHIEYQGGLYYDEDLGPVLPSINFEKCMVEAARLQKNGKSFERGFTVDEIIVPLEYDGPRTVEALWEDANFRNVSFVKIGMSRVKRTRPAFHDWSAEFTARFDESLLTRKLIEDTAKTAGSLIGLGDWRPRFGRFEVKVK